MSGQRDSRRRGGRPPIGEEAKRVYLTALGRGATEAEAAGAAGYSRSAFSRLRNRDVEFLALWEAATERSIGPRFISRGAGRKIQIRRNRRVIFTEKRQQVFFDRFAGTCNLTEAAEAAGVSESTIYAHLKDPDFAARFEEALAICHVGLEAELVRRRLDAQRLLRAIVPTGEFEPEFDRALKLLQRWDRRHGKVGRRSVAHGRQQRWTFDEAMALLVRKLKAMRVAPRLPPPAADLPGGDDPE